jgi:chemotaxis protein MotB
MGHGKKCPEHVNHERWLVSYADFITLLFAFFVVMFAVSQVDSKKTGRFTESFAQAMGFHPLPPGGTGLLPAEVPANLPSVLAKALTQQHGNGAEATPEEIKAQLQAKLAERMELEKFELIAKDQELILRFNSSLLFESGDARLSDKACEVLRVVADQLRELDVVIRVEGHTDNLPTQPLMWKSNWELSSARSVAVLLELTGPDALDADRLTMAAWGSWKPIAPNDSEQGRAKNRRVDLVVSWPQRLGAGT